MCCGNRLRVATSLLIVAAVSTTGCRTASHAEHDSLVGGGLGALAGAIIGHNTGSGHAGAGAVLGAMAGGVGGAIVGDAKDAREERDAAIAHAQYTQHARAADQARRMALTNSDVIVMSRNGLSDDLIISTIRSRGGRFRTDPNAIIELNASGVSDAVILAMQQTPAAPQIVTVESAPDVVVVPARPAVGVYLGPGPRRHVFHHRHCY